KTELAVQAIARHRQQVSRRWSMSRADRGRRQIAEQNTKEMVEQSETLAAQKTKETERRVNNRKKTAAKKENNNATEKSVTPTLVDRGAMAMGGGKLARPGEIAGFLIRREGQRVRQDNVPSSAVGKDLGEVFEARPSEEATSKEGTKDGEREEEQQAARARPPGAGNRGHEGGASGLARGGSEVRGRDRSHARPLEQVAACGADTPAELADTMPPHLLVLAGAWHYEREGGPQEAGDELDATPRSAKTCTRKSSRWWP
ncbi:hypothetical protein N9L19_01110, partial [bacterium]|nr:hypothetical protein [bacterium]